MHPDTLHRYSTQRAACKLWGVALGVVIVLVGALGKIEAASLLAAALPLVLLGLVDAAYAGQERRCLELLKNKKGNDELAGLLPESAGASVVRTTHAALSLSIWPFYLGLLGIAAAGNGIFPLVEEHAAHRIVHTAAPAVPAAAAKSGCGSGGCGSAGGCGSGGCGASAGKSCSGGASKTNAAKQPVQKPVQQYLQTATGPMPLQSQPQKPVTGPAPLWRAPINAANQRNAAPLFQRPVAPANSAPVPVISQPALNGPIPAVPPLAPAPAAPASANPNTVPVPASPDAVN